MSITYFVSYTGTSAKGTHFGRCDITTKLPITGTDRLEEIEKAIMEKNGFTWCAVTNWKRFEEHA